MSEQWNDGNSGYPFGAGIYVDAAGQEDHIHVHDNIIHDCNAGISINAEEYSGVADNLFNVVVRNNVINRTKYNGVSVSNNGAGGGLTYNILVLNNTVRGNPYSSWSNINAGVSVGANTSNTLVRNNLLIGLSQGVAINATVAASTTADNNITAASFAFADEAAGDFHLVAGSPAIDTGHPDPLYNDPDGTRNDVGAYHFPKTPTPREIDVRYAEPWVFQPAIPNGDPTPTIGEGTDFGEQNVPFGRTDRRFLIRNAGGAALFVGAITITGTNATDFLLVQTPSSSSFAPAQAIEFVVGFDPTAAGIRNAIVRIANDDSDENPYSFAVTGKGVITIQDIAVSYNAENIIAGTQSPTDSQGTDFGAVNVAGGATIHDFTVQNAGGADLTLSAQIQGPHSADFSIFTPPASVLSGGQTTTLGIRFDPAKGGTRLATIRLNSNDPDENPLDFRVMGLGNDAPYLQDAAGMVCFEAEGLHSNMGGTLAAEGVFWKPLTDTLASDGVYMLAPAGGLIPYDISPRMRYNIYLVQNSPLYIWVRGSVIVDNAGDDSIFVDFDGAQIGANFNTNNNLNWGWTKFGTTIANPTVGHHTFSVRIREDGCKVDKIVLTTSNSYNPGTISAGLGPDPSVRFGGVVQNPPYFPADPFSADDARVNQAYNSSIAGKASDKDAGDTLAYSKVSGPAWLSISGGGILAGTPGEADAGIQSFVVRVQDSTGLWSAGVLRIFVRLTGETTSAVSWDTYR
jgi:hypothetical protein